MEINEKTGVYIGVEPSKWEKCARCWMRREEVGTVLYFPDICSRCFLAVVECILCGVAEPDNEEQRAFCEKTYWWDADLTSEQKDQHLEKLKEGYRKQGKIC